MTHQEGCICCANGNDLPDGEYCRACGREGTATGLRAAVIKARGRSEPPSVPVQFDGPMDFERVDTAVLCRAFGLTVAEAKRGIEHTGFLYRRLASPPPGLIWRRAMGECLRPRWLRRCQFEPRYDETFTGNALSAEQVTALGENCFMDDLPKAIKNMGSTTRTYWGDVCTRCGATTSVKAGERSEG